MSRELLTRAVAYKIQEQAFGGLKPATSKLLLRLAGDAREGRPLKLAAAPPYRPERFCCATGKGPRMK